MKINKNTAIGIFLISSLFCFNTPLAFAEIYESKENIQKQLGEIENDLSNLRLKYKILQETYPNENINNLSFSELSKLKQGYQEISEGITEKNRIKNDLLNKLNYGNGKSSDIKENAKFSGFIYDKDGKPITGAKVTALSSEPGINFNQESQSDSNGEYVFINIPLGARLKISVVDNEGKKLDEKVIIPKSNITGDPNANKLDFKNIPLKSQQVTKSVVVEPPPIENKDNLSDKDKEIVKNSDKNVAKSDNDMESILKGFHFSTSIGINIPFSAFSGIPLVKDGTAQQIKDGSNTKDVFTAKDYTYYNNRLMLETHIFPFLFHEDMAGIGPFLTISPGITNIVDGSIGFGCLFGFRYNKDSENSINVGLGILFEPKVKLPKFGIEINKTIPENFKNDKGQYELFTETSFISPLLIISYSFK